MMCFELEKFIDKKRYLVLHLCESYIVCYLNIMKLSKNYTRKKKLTNHKLRGKKDSY
jgi:hypothetical protein